MSRPLYRSAYARPLSAAVIAAAVAVVSVGPVRADGAVDSDVRASMQCERASEPGRVRCSVEARIEGGRTIAWADVEILGLPDFASALKGRIGPQDALSRDATSAKWALGLVARRAGQGEARARVRLVACEGPRSGPAPADAGASAPARCAPVTVEIKAQITVGG